MPSQKLIPMVQCGDKRPPELSNRPKGSAFTQQKWNAQRPLYHTHVKALVLFFSVFILGLVVGSVSLSAAAGVQEVTVRYDNLSDCLTNAISWETSKADPSAEGNKICHATITLTKDMPAPVYLYYELDSVYQTHKRYFSSVYASQLKGDEPTSFNGETEGCSEAQLYRTSDTTDYRLLATVQGSYLNPCGHVAASYFNDTFDLTKGPSFTTSVQAKTTSYVHNSMPTPYGIAWSSDKDKRFDASTNQWTNSLTLLENGVEDERFIVWMRPPPQYNFRKLYMVITEDLTAGTYRYSIRNRWPVSGFNGAKRLVLSTTSHMGGKNWALGITGILVSVGSLLLFIVVLFTSLLSAPLHTRRSFEDLINRKTLKMVEKGHISDLASNMELRMRHNTGVSETPGSSSTTPMFHAI